MQSYKLYINGKYQDSTSDIEDISYNPTTNEPFAKVQLASIQDAKHAVDVAHTAFQTWKDVQPSKRERILLKVADLLETRADEFKELLIDEAGSTQLKAGYETHHAPSFLRSMAGECRRVTGETYLSDYPGVKSYSVRRPLGVVLAIAPFNFPLLLGLRKVGWALAAGNCVILKPSEVTPVIGLKIAEVFTEAGLPPGVLNVIPANGADFGDALISNPLVKKVTFTGSSRVGKALSIDCAKHGKSITLEMGGKNPFIVLNDADIDYAVDAAAFSNFLHQGQVCMAGSRIIVEANIYDEFVTKFTEKVKNIPYGNPRDAGVIVGPLIRPTQTKLIKDLVDQAIAEGATLSIGGDYLGNVFQPTVISDVNEKMPIFHTECFGPIACVIKAIDYQHALELANNSEYGLSAAVITNDLQKSYYFSERLEAGMVHINGPSVRDEPIVPFGGVKNSGKGREGGSFIMNELTELKWITVQVGQQKFPF